MANEFTHITCGWVGYAFEMENDVYQGVIIGKICPKCQDLCPFFDDDIFPLVRMDEEDEDEDDDGRYFRNIRIT